MPPLALRVAASLGAQHRRGPAAFPRAVRGGRAVRALQRAECTVERPKGALASRAAKWRSVSASSGAFASRIPDRGFRDATPLRACTRTLTRAPPEPCDAFARACERLARALLVHPHGLPGLAKAGYSPSAVCLRNGCDATTPWCKWEGRLPGPWRGPGRALNFGIPACEAGVVPRRHGASSTGSCHAPFRGDC